MKWPFVFRSRYESEVASLKRDVSSNEKFFAAQNDRQAHAFELRIERLVDCMESVADDIEETNEGASKLIRWHLKREGR